MSELRCIGIFSRSELTMFGVEELPTSQIDYDGKNYREVGTGDFSGFYDWLRATPDRIVGVRFLPSEKNEFILSAYSAASFATAVPEGGVELMFSREPAVESLCDDQDFGGNRMFVSDDGEAIVTFAVDSLSDRERHSIQETQATWVTLSAVT